MPKSLSKKAVFEHDILGVFDSKEILSLRDEEGKFWFSTSTIAAALGISRPAIIKARDKSPDFLQEGEEFAYFTMDGKRQCLYSETGFLEICSLISSPTAVHLRRWMWKQFTVKHSGGKIKVGTRDKRMEEMTDLGPEFVAMQQHLDNMAAERRRIMELARAQEAMAESQKALEEGQRTLSAHQHEIVVSLDEHQRQLDLLNQSTKIRPGELTAIQLAGHCRWRTSNGGPHNLGVILAGINAGYHLDGGMREILEEGPSGHGKVKVVVFTASGVARFLREIDGQYHTGQWFEITPNKIAEAEGYKNKRYVQRG